MAVPPPAYGPVLFGDDDFDNEHYGPNETDITANHFGSASILNGHPDPSGAETLLPASSIGNNSFEFTADDLALNGTGYGIFSNRSVPWLTDKQNATAGVLNGLTSVGPYLVGDFAEFPAGIAGGLGFVGVGEVMYTQLQGQIFPLTDYTFTVDYCTSFEGALEENVTSAGDATMTIIVSDYDNAVGLHPTSTALKPVGFTFGRLNTLTSLTVQSGKFNANVTYVNQATSLNPTSFNVTQFFNASSHNATCGTLRVEVFHYDLFAHLNLNRTFTVFLYGPADGTRKRQTTFANRTIFYDTPAVATKVRPSATFTSATNTLGCTTIFVNEIDYVVTQQSFTTRDNVTGVNETEPFSTAHLEIVVPACTNVSTLFFSFFNATGNEILRTSFDNVTNQSLPIVTNYYPALPPNAAGASRAVAFLELQFPGGIFGGALGAGSVFDGAGVAIFNGEPTGTNAIFCLTFDGNTTTESNGFFLAPAKTPTCLVGSTNVVLVDSQGNSLRDTSTATSLQLTGCGSCYEHFDWIAAPPTYQIVSSAFTSPTNTPLNTQFDPTNFEQSFCFDNDGDGSWQGAQTFGLNDAGHVTGTLSPPIAACCNGNDCNDFYAQIRPQAPEICDGFVDNCGFPFGVTGLTAPLAETLSANETDSDGDGRIPCDGDCDDTEEDVFGQANSVTGNIFYPNSVFIVKAGISTLGHTPVALVDLPVEATIANCNNSFDVTFTKTCNIDNITDTSCDLGAPHPEICDGLDNNCNCPFGVPNPVDGVPSCVDELWNQVIYFPDADNDGFGDSHLTTADAASLPTFANCTVLVNVTFPNGTSEFLPESPFVGFASNNLDCNDNNPLLTIASVEVCDGVDNDCDGVIDNGFSTVGPLFVPVDGDKDGFFNYNSTTCFAFYGAFDCNDTNPIIKPNNTNFFCSCFCELSFLTPTPCTNALTSEVCDQLDNNCNGLVDEGLVFDNDKDGFLGPQTSVSCCGTPIEPVTIPVGFLQPQGYNSTICRTDCNDNDPTIFPGAPDIVCDGKINNCTNVQDLADVIQISDKDGDCWFAIYGENVTPQQVAICKQNFKKGFGLFDCDDLNCDVHPADPVCNSCPNDTCGICAPTEVEFKSNGAGGYFGDHLDNDCNGIVDDIIDDFVRFEIDALLLALDDAAGDESNSERGDDRKRTCVPNFALVFTLTNLASNKTATNAIVKGRLSLPHNARLPTQVLGDLTSYGVKIDAKTGALTWVQFALASLAQQQVAVPLCFDLNSRHPNVVQVAINVTSADQQLFDTLLSDKRFTL